MYILVRLLKGFPKPLFYKIPQNFSQNDLEGKVVNVPIKNYDVPALVLKTYDEKPKKITFKIKEINELQKFPDDLLFHEFIKKISKFYFVNPLYFYQRIRGFILKNEFVKQELFTQNNQELTNEIYLTKEQTQIINNLKDYIDKNKYKPVLLHGVTGSGKTEIYKNLILESIKKNKSVILLLPEVTLALQFEDILKKQLPNFVNIIGFHSASNNSDKKNLWQMLLDKKPILIIGVHLPILLPISNLGLIIVDEEHETGFQEKKYPKINSKELALWRAQFYKIPIILGSATPSLNSLYNVKNKNWDLQKLEYRFSGAFPKIELVFLKNKENKNKKSFWISKQLEEAISDKLTKKEQIIIYINRRGFSFFIQCKNCGHIFECPNCSVSLTLHKNNNLNNEKLVCHYCDYTKDLPKFCPECNPTKDSYLRKGIGTQQAVQILSELFPKAIIERADLDTTSKKKKWGKTVERFERGEIDILVGTQVVTKGYHFPNVTLVGIIWSDLNLHFPIFNAAETTLQKLIQVAGRAGRSKEDSKVIVQAINEHDIFNYLNEKDYLNFVKEELSFRQLIQYPPYTRLVQIEIKNSNTEQLELDTNNLFKKLNLEIKKINSNITLLGPAKPIVYKIQKVEYRHIFVKTCSFSSFYEIMKNINLKEFKSNIFITPT